MKTFFIVPGFKMKPNHTAFKWLNEFLKQRKVKTIHVPVHWNHRTLTQNAEDFISFYGKNKGDENYILGFSYGAVITLLAANTVMPEKIFLCSLSPDFVEDRDKMSLKERKEIGTRRFENTKNRSGITLAKELNVPSVVFYGEREAEEFSEIEKRAEETAKFAKNSKLVKVEGAPHKIDFPAYIEAIKKELMNI
jgi:pimeloyl-ACP methyl ester carboxylesterase